jgi:hypothetical protein
MPGLVPGIHAFESTSNDVDGRGPACAKPSFASAKAGKPGHNDCLSRTTPAYCTRSGDAVSID